MRRRALLGNRLGVQIPTGNLVLYNRFNNSLTDETGNHTLSGTVAYGAPLASGGDASVSFTTTSNYITIPDSNLFSFGNGATDSAFSISTLIRFNSFGGSIDMILNKRGDNGTSNSSIYREYQLYRRASDGKIIFLLWDDSAGAFIAQIGSTVLSTATNYHLVVTYDGSSTAAGIKIYLNGIAETTTPFSSGTYTAMENLSAPLAIATQGWTLGSGNNFVGRLDGLGMWDIGLSTEVVTAVKNKQLNGQNLL